MKLGFFRKNKLLALGILIIFISVLISRILFFNYKFTLLWDEAEYMLGAMYYIRSLPSGCMPDIIRPFFLSLMLAGLGPSEIGGRILEMFFTAGLCIMTFILGRKYFSNKAGFLAGIITCFSWMIFYYSQRILTSIPSAFFLMVSLYFLLNKKTRKNQLFSGLFFGFAFLMRFSCIYVLPLFFFYSILTSKKRVIDFSIGAFAVLILLFIHDFAVYSNALTSLSAGTTYFIKPITDASYYFNNYFSIFGQSIGWLFIISLIYFTYKSIRNIKIIKKNNYLILLLFFLSFFIGFSFMNYTFDLRFMIYIIPISILMMSVLLSDFISFNKKKGYERLNLIIYLVIIIILVENINIGNRALIKGLYVNNALDEAIINLEEYNFSRIYTNAGPQVCYYSNANNEIISLESDFNKVLDNILNNDIILVSYYEFLDDDFTRTLAESVNNNQTRILYHQLDRGELAAVVLRKIS